jgi:hypothetical protein
MPRSRKVKRKARFVYDRIGKRVEYFELWLEEHTAWRLQRWATRRCANVLPAAAMPSQLTA